MKRWRRKWRFCVWTRWFWKREKAEFFHQFYVRIIKVREKVFPILGGKPYGNVVVMERRLVNSSFNQWCGFSEIFLIGLKDSIGSELVWIVHSWWWTGPFWPWGEVININHQLFSFIATSFHSRSLEWRQFHTASYYTKEQGKLHKNEGFISTRLVPNHNTWRNP